jgi:hypothetical protein
VERGNLVSKDLKTEPEALLCLRKRFPGLTVQWARLITHPVCSGCRYYTGGVLCNADRAPDYAASVGSCGKYEGEAITRAALIAEIRDSNLREHSPLHWSEEESARRERVEAGVTVVANLRGANDKYLLNWARFKGLLVRVNRSSEWGNPFKMPADGDRDTVCAHYALHYLSHKPSLLNKIHSLKGKVLACWCYPERCHGDYLAEWVNEHR